MDIGKPYLKQTYNKASGRPCVKLYQLVELPDGRQTPKQLEQFETLAEAKAQHPDVEVK